MDPSFDNSIGLPIVIEDGIEVFVDDNVSILDFNNIKTVYEEVTSPELITSEQIIHTENDETAQEDIFTVQDLMEEKGIKEEPVKIRTRHRLPVPDNWVKNVTKKNRMTGQPFFGYQRKKSNEKMTVSRTDFEREE